MNYNNGMNNNMMNNNMQNMAQRNLFSQPYYNNSPAMMPTNNIIWVQGMEGAKAWQLNPNSRAILLDSEVEGKMYIKVCDDIGISSLRKFHYVEEVDAKDDTTKGNVDLSQYVRKDELRQTIKEILDEQVISTTSTTSAKKHDDGAAATTATIPSNIEF